MTNTMDADTNIKKIELDVKERASILPEDIAEIFSLGILDQVLEETSETYELSTKQTRMLRLEIELVLMSFLPRTNFAKRIERSMELSESTALAIDSHIDYEIFSLVDDILSLVAMSFPNNIDEDPDAGPTEKNIAPPTPESTGATTSTPDDDDQIIQPLRTMEGDVDRVHGYGAYRKLYDDEDSDKRGADTTIRALSQEETINGAGDNQGYREDPKPPADKST